LQEEVQEDLIIAVRRGN
jgi:ubiquitin-protein ligase E3 C